MQFWFKLNCHYHEQAVCLLQSSIWIIAKVTLLLSFMLERGLNYASEKCGVWFFVFVFYPYHKVFLLSWKTKRKIIIEHFFSLFKSIKGLKDFVLILSIKMTIDIICLFSKTQGKTEDCISRSTPEHKGDCGNCYEIKWG